MTTILRRRVYAGLFTALLLFLVGCAKEFTQDDINKMEKSKFEGLQDKIRKRVGILAATDDEPVTMAGGSMRIGLSSHQSWTRASSKKMTHSYEAAVVRSVELVLGDESHPLTRNSQDWSIIVEYNKGRMGKNRNSKISFLTEPATSGLGTNLSLNSVDGPGLQQFLRYGDYTMEHPNRNWEIATITFETGTDRAGLPRGPITDRICDHGTGACDVRGKEAGLVLHLCAKPGGSSTGCN